MNEQISDEDLEQVGLAIDAGIIMKIPSPENLILQRLKEQNQV